MQHSKRIESFGIEDERFFGSYEAERISAEVALTLEFDPVEAPTPTSEQRAHLTRFRKPVAWVMVAMSSLSLLALGQGLQKHSRPEFATHSASVKAVPAAERPSEAPWSWTEFAESASAVLLDPFRPSTSGSKPRSLGDTAEQASLVEDFTSELMSVCRDAHT